MSGNRSSNAWRRLKLWSELISAAPYKGGRIERLEFVVIREGDIIEYLQRHHSGEILRIPIMRIEGVTSGLEGVVLKESSAGLDGCPITNSYYICKEKKRR